MSNETIRFGDVIKLQTVSASTEDASESCLGFFDLSQKAQTQLLIVPPVKDEVKDRFVEAEFIISPIKSDKPQANGTPLTCGTPFVLCTSDGIDGSTYSLNNKVAGQCDSISLQVSATKGEMYMQVEKDGCTELFYGTDGLSLRVVDSNRVRKTLNTLLTQMVRPKSDILGGMVTCGAKGVALAFRFQRAVDKNGQLKTETIKYIKTPRPRRTSLTTFSPTKRNALRRVDRIDSSEGSDVDAMSRSSSLTSFGSNPASPKSMMTPVNGVERLLVVKHVKEMETEATASPSLASTSLNDGMGSVPANALSNVPLQPVTQSVSPATSASLPKSGFHGAKAKALPALSSRTFVAAVSPRKVEKAEVMAESGKAKSFTEGAMAIIPDGTKPQVETSKPVDFASPPLPLAATDAAPAAPHERQGIVTDAPTSPLMPVTNLAPAPVVPSQPKPTLSAAAMLSTVPLGPKMLNDEEVAKLKTEAEVENLDPACGALCGMM